MPSVANKNFPYHVRTTQIGIMELTGGTAGASTIEQFGHHVYEPSDLREPTVIVPLTRRTEEIFEGMYSPAMRSSALGRTTEAIPTPPKDNVMENVINWSLARNIAAIEMPELQRMKRNSYGNFHNAHIFTISSRMLAMIKLAKHGEDRLNTFLFLVQNSLFFFSLDKLEKSDKCRCFESKPIDSSRTPQFQRLRQRCPHRIVYD